jgi:hypothetical protein
MLTSMSAAPKDSRELPELDDSSLFRTKPEFEEKGFGDAELKITLLALRRRTDWAKDECCASFLRALLAAAKETTRPPLGP